MKGTFSRNISVSTNDPNAPTVKLTCAGKILEPLYMNPKVISFGRISRKDNPPPKTATITRGDGGPLKLKLKTLKTPGFKVELREIEAREKYELEVQIIPPFNSRRTRVNLEFDTGIPESPTVTLRAYASIPARVTAIPRRFTIPGNRQDVWKATARLVWDDAVSYKILEASVNDPKLTVRVVEKSGTQRVELEVPKDYDPGTTPRAVTIKTDDAQMPTIRVPILSASRGGRMSDEERIKRKAAARAAAARKEASRSNRVILGGDASAKETPESVKRRIRASKADPSAKKAEKKNPNID